MEEFAEKRGVQVLLDIANAVTEKLIERGIEEGEARQVGLETAETVRDTFGGEQLYVPKGLHLVVSQRDREIWRKFDGKNVFQLSKEYGLTERQVYSIVARVRDEEFNKRQGKLF